MAKLLSVKLQDTIFEETESILKDVSKTRNSYINEAVDFYNRLHQRSQLRKILQKESSLVATSSLEVLREFEALDD